MNDLLSSSLVDPTINLMINVLLFALIIWGIIWKGIALWKAAGLKQKRWFIVMLILNTTGLLEMSYIFFFSKRNKKE